MPQLPSILVDMFASLDLTPLVFILNGLCLCYIMVFVYCYIIHFMIFLCAALLCSSEERSNPENYMARAPLPPWLQLGSANGRCCRELGEWEEEISQGVSSILSALWRL